MAEAEAVNPAAVLIDAGFKLVEAGIEELKKGDVVVRKPDSPVGVRAENMPEELRAKLTLITQRKVIWTYRATKAGLQTASIKLVCEVQYNGPEVQAAFDLAPDGMRARLGTDATIEIQTPLLLDRLAAPPGWRAAGFKLLPVSTSRGRTPTSRRPSTSCSRACTASASPPPTRECSTTRSSPTDLAR
jgi:hypothetical protein